MSGISIRVSSTSWWTMTWTLTLIAIIILSLTRWSSIYNNVYLDCTWRLLNIWRDFVALTWKWDCVRLTVLWTKVNESVEHCCEMTELFLHLHLQTTIYKPAAWATVRRTSQRYRQWPRHVSEPTASDFRTFYCHVALWYSENATLRNFGLCDTRFLLN